MANYFKNQFLIFIFFILNKKISRKKMQICIQIRIIIQVLD